MSQGSFPGGAQTKDLWSHSREQLGFCKELSALEYCVRSFAPSQLQLQLQACADIPAAHVFVVRAVVFHAFFKNTYIGPGIGNRMEFVPQ